MKIEILFFVLIVIFSGCVFDSREKVSYESTKFSNANFYRMPDRQSFEEYYIEDAFFHVYTISHGLVSTEGNSRFHLFIQSWKESMESAYMAIEDITIQSNLHGRLDLNSEMNLPVFSEYVDNQGGLSVAFAPFNSLLDLYGKSGEKITIEMTVSFEQGEIRETKTMKYFFEPVIHRSLFQLVKKNTS